MFRIKKLRAKPVSYDSAKRNRADVKYIVIHWTGNTKDTAKNNAVYFATNNTRQAGAHLFIDQKGNIIKSVSLNHAAWSVGGGLFTKCNGAAKYFKKCTNHNSVSVELCAFTPEYPKKQAKAVKKAIKYIRKYCPNATTVIRHWDVNGKDCPHGMTGHSNETWVKFLRDIGEM